MATPKRLYVVRLDITEAATKHAYPVVRHEFFGKTKAEARRYFASHMRTDSFMRGCVKRGRWTVVECAVHRSEGWVALG